MGILLWIILGLALILIVWVIATFNHFVTLRTRVKEALADIDVQLKRRYDLIPNVVETVKGYATHEREVLENVTKARTEAMGAHDRAEQAEKENILSNTLKTLFAVAENYPDLNILVETFPSRIIAGMFNFGKEEFFEVATSGEREPVQVKF